MCRYRLKTRNDYLEKEVEHLKDTLTRLEEDRFDVIAHLKRKLFYKNEEARELGEHLLAIGELRKEEQLAYTMKEQAMKLEYHNMETNLNAEVKLVSEFHDLIGYTVIILSILKILSNFLYQYPSFLAVIILTKFR